MDIAVFNAGSVVILSGVTFEGQQWLSEHLPEDSMRWGVNGWMVEPRYVADILDGARNDGLRIEGDENGQ
jgi:hypothetical protein